MYQEASAWNLAEVQGDRPITDFLLAIKTKHSAYAAVQLSNLDWKPKARSMHQFIKSYRQNQTCVGQMNHLREYLDLKTDASFKSMASLLHYWKDTAKANSSIPASHKCDHSFCETTALTYSKQADELNQEKSKLSEDLKQARAQIE